MEIIIGATENARNENASKNHLGLRRKYLLDRQCCTRVSHGKIVYSAENEMSIVLQFKSVE